MITIKDFNKLILDKKIVVIYIDPDGILLCTSKTKVNDFLNREVIRIIDVWERDTKQFMQVLVSV